MAFLKVIGKKAESDLEQNVLMPNSPKCLLLKQFSMLIFAMHAGLNVAVSDLTNDVFI